jgi:hypothetical protein
MFPTDALELLGMAAFKKRVNLLENTAERANAVDCEHDGINLLCLRGKDYGKWALNAARALFTEEELRTHFVLPTEKTKRFSLMEKDDASREKVKLLERALYIKWKIDLSKQNKCWEH